MRVAWLTLVMSVAGCSGVTVHSLHSPGDANRHCATYAWFGPAGAPMSDEQRRLRDALGRRLAWEGVPEAEDGTAECRISFKAIEERKLVVSDWGSGLNDREPEVTHYSERTVVLDFVEPRTNRVFWRGVATRAMAPPDAADERRLEQVVSMLIGRSPASRTLGLSRASRVSARRQ